MRNNKGFAEIMIVFILCIVGLMVVTAWESRLFTSIHRMTALTDTLRATYGSESIINDAIARFLGEYPNRKDGTITMEDQTKITTKLQSSSNTDIFTVLAERQFATTNIVLTRTKNTTEGEGINKLETILITDCTQSMSDPAKSSCEDACGAYTDAPNKNTYLNCLASHKCTTRMHELKKASLDFVDNLIEFKNNNPTKNVLLGWTVFRVDAKHVNEMTADLNLVKSKISSGLADLQPDSSACNLVSSNTSIGSGIDLANKFYIDEPLEPKTKRFEVMVSDGEPNSRHSSYTGLCGTQNCTSCKTAANDFMQCALKKIEQGGSRPNDVNAYTVTVIDSVVAEVGNILNTYSTKYFNQADATKLTEILSNIFDEIVSSTTTINIRRIIPTPEE